MYSGYAAAIPETHSTGLVPSIPSLKNLKLLDKIKRKKITFS
jgi:hypothetical protein